MNCPRCKSELSGAEIEGVAVSRCGACHGVWFDEEGFRLAKDHAEPNAMWMDVELWKDPERFAIESRGFECPSCVKPLATLRYGETQVVIDTCPRCRGIWLDDHEFEHIITALEDELARMPASELLGNALREAAEIVKGPEPVLSEWRDVGRVLNLLKLRVMVEHPALSQLFLGFEEGTPFN
jgi:Zn-finger nucleic acid-binding protein